MTKTKTVRLKQQYQEDYEDAAVIPPGVYGVTDFNYSSYQILHDGPYNTYLIPKGLCEDVETKEYSIKYVTDLEIKLSKAGRELVESRAENDQIKRQVKEANRVLEGVTTLLGYIQQESVGFEIDPTTPLGSLETIRRVLKRKATEIKELKDGDPNKKTINDIKAELDLIDKMDDVDFVVNKEYPVTALQNIRYNLATILKDQPRRITSEGAIHRIVDDMLSRYGITCEHSLYEKVTLLSENVNGNREVKVPSDVAKALDKHIQDKELPFEIFYAYAEEMSKKTPHSHKVNTDHIVSDYVFMKGLIHFFDIMKNGYVAEKTEREKKIDQIQEIFDGTNSNVIAADLIYDLFNKEVVDNAD